MTIAVTRRALIGGALALPVAVRAGGPVAMQRVLKARDGRDIAVTMWPARGRRRGIILFSHGALSSPSKYPDMVDRWTAAGYDIHAPLHVDSLQHPQHKAFVGLQGWAARIEDMRALSAALGAPYLAVGHSYGALTALVLGGAQATIPEGVAGPLRDPMVQCVVAFSPPPPIPPLITAEGYAGLATPALITTGTRDLLPGQTNPNSWHGHLAAFDAARPGGHRYAAVFEGANHYFGGLICDYSQPGPPQPHQLRQATDSSLLFLAAFDGKAAENPDGLPAKLRRQPDVQILDK